MRSESLRLPHEVFSGGGGGAAAAGFAAGAAAGFAAGAEAVAFFNAGFDGAAEAREETEKNNISY